MQVQRQSRKCPAVRLVAFNDDDVPGAVQAQMRPSFRAAGILCDKNAQSASSGEAQLAGESGYEAGLDLVACGSSERHASAENLARKHADVGTSDALLQPAPFSAAQFGCLPSNEQVNAGLLHRLSPVAAPLGRSLEGLDLALGEHVCAAVLGGNDSACGCGTPHLPG